jgi:hypothetical protein
MECYEGATMIKTFRGMMADGDQDTIVLHTNDGSTGYRIVKFELFPNLPGTSDYESLVKIFKVAQTTVPTSSGTADFSDNELVAAGLYVATSSTAPISFISIFEQEIFNQDIYLTHTANSGSAAINYYVELEQVKLDINANTVATLKDMRNTASPRP